MKETHSPFARPLLLTLSVWLAVVATGVSLTHRHGDGEAEAEAPAHRHLILFGVECPGESAPGATVTVAPAPSATPTATDTSGADDFTGPPVRLATLRSARPHVPPVETSPVTARHPWLTRTANLRL